MPLAPSRFANQQWNLPAFGGAGANATPGVSLGYVPQQQAIGDPRNQAVIDAAKLGIGGTSSATTPASSSVPADLASWAKAASQSSAMRQMIDERIQSDWNKFNPGAAVGPPRIKREQGDYTNYVNYLTNNPGIMGR